MTDRCKYHVYIQQGEKLKSSEKLENLYMVVCMVLRMEFRMVVKKVEKMALVRRW